MKAPSRLILTLLAAGIVLLPLAAVAQYGGHGEDPPQGGLNQHAVEASDAFTRAELDQMLAPVALYPDVLLSQVLIASTYPLEVVEAARWSRDNPHLRGEDAVAAVAHRDWDPAVMALVAFPDLLSRMSEDLAWTRRLGDAFLYQEADVVDAVQGLRWRAHDAGNLRSGEQVRVVHEERVIHVQPASPRVVYVPYYDPVVVYGGWAWPAYRPHRWAPPRVYHSGVTFHWGYGVPVSAGFFFSTLNWHTRHVVLVQNHVHLYSPRPSLRHYDRWPRWQHNPVHRRGVLYRHRAVSARYAGRSQGGSRWHERGVTGDHAPRLRQGTRSSSGSAGGVRLQGDAGSRSRDGVRFADGGISAGGDRRADRDGPRRQTGAAGRSGADARERISVRGDGGATTGRLSGSRQSDPSLGRRPATESRGRAGADGSDGESRWLPPRTPATGAGARNRSGASSSALGGPTLSAPAPAERTRQPARGTSTARDPASHRSSAERGAWPRSPTTGTRSAPRTPSLSGSRTPSLSGGTRSGQAARGARGESGDAADRQRGDRGNRQTR